MVSFLQESHRNLVHFYSLLRATCSNHLIVLDVITPIIYAEEYKSRNSSLSSIFRIAVFPSPQVRMFSSAPFTRKPPVYILHWKWGTTIDTHTHTHTHPRARARTHTHTHTHPHPHTHTHKHTHESKKQNNNLGVLICTYLGNMQKRSYTEEKNNYFHIFGIIHYQFKSHSCFRINIFYVLLRTVWLFFFFRNI